MFLRTNINMIVLREDLSHLFEIDRALGDGEIVSIPADRAETASKFIEHEFLGAKAKFPQGPFSLASMRALDALAINVMKEGAKKYRIFVTLLQYDKTLPRRQQVSQLCAAYAAELEKRVKEYPLQWFNYFDFWE